MMTRAAKRPAARKRTAGRERPAEPRQRSPEAKAAKAIAREVEAMIDRFSPPLAKLIRAGRAALRKRWPTAVELVYDNYALALGYGASERLSDCMVSLACYPRGVNLYFIWGAALPDPEQRLSGSGNQGRFIRFEDPSLLDEPAVDVLLHLAVAQLKTPLPESGRGATVIKTRAGSGRARR
jgi:hypothetical protein